MAALEIDLVERVTSRARGLTDSPYGEAQVLYHVTSEEAARSILRDGFLDGRGTYLTIQEWTGVWLSDSPVSVNEGAQGETILAVDIPLDLVLDYEWVEEGKPYREFLVPARLVNAYPVRRAPDDE
jgi:hypothetical protein